MPIKECVTCGDEFEVVESRVEEAKFCSRECYHSGQKRGLTSHDKRRVEYEEVECTNCGKTIEKPPSRVNRSERQFCGQDCYLEWSKSHQKKRHGRRKRMREKESASCQICGFDRFIEMAHIIDSSDGGTYHKNNILFLCPNHHELFDRGKLSPDEFSEIMDQLRASVIEGDGRKDPRTEVNLSDE